ncbi:MAG: hypothetical protein IJ390_12950 [Lachnospiraceae bacterium]|nr:hypothetical protein [Lachnospiraceae bacterium]
MTDTERKLQLTRFVREENAMNRAKIRNREEILYGKGNLKYSPNIMGKSKGKENDYPLVYDGYLEDDSFFNVPSERPIRSTFGIRMIMAVLLMGAMIYMDKSGSMFQGEKVSEIISAQLSIDMEEKISEFVSVFNGG